MSNSGPALPTGRGERNTVRDLVEADRELDLLRELIQAASSGPGVEPLAAAAARMITDATGADVCFVHVLEDSDRSLTLAGATPPFDSQVGRIRLPLGSGISGWVASHREPVVITEDKESDPPVPSHRVAAGIGFHIHGVGANGDRPRRVGRRANGVHRRTTRVHFW